jgi:hypothetical protein
MLINFIQKYFQVTTVEYITQTVVKPTETYVQILNRAIFAKKEKGYKGNLKNIRTFIWIWLQHISCKHRRGKTCHLTATIVVYLLY